eukprot:m.241141 g.241141  ORF g.241141 m.241141 type:complete len:294 (+) comp40201_c0_seq1:710-1591(+)
MSSLDEAVSNACAPFGVQIYQEQCLCIVKLVGGNDVFGCFPTGYGKSLIYQILPGVVQELRRARNPAVLVISPLKSLMRDQIAFLRERGIITAQIGYSEVESNLVKNGEATVIFSSPEMVIDKEAWLDILCGPQVKSRLAAIVVDEVIPLLNGGGRKSFPELLRQNRCVENRLFGMLHSGSAQSTKEVILASLAAEEGKCRVIFCTSSLGMGVNVRNLHTVIHYGPPETLEEYQQEVGRAGRDGKSSQAIMLWNSRLLRKASVEVRKYATATASEGCLRLILMEYFGFKKKSF